MSTSVTPALKEWAVVVRALLEGEQILDVRKGGLREEGRHFDVQASKFWLYPTAEHQRAELVKPAYRRWVEPPCEDRSFAVAGWAEVVGVATVTEPEVLEGLDGKLIWTLEYAASRFNWKRRDPLWLLALRVHRLREAIAVPYRDEYGGCTSWVDLDGLPDDPTTLQSEPALSDIAFEGKLKSVREAIAPVELLAP